MPFSLGSFKLWPSTCVLWRPSCWLANFRATTFWCPLTKDCLVMSQHRKQGHQPNGLVALQTPGKKTAVPLNGVLQKVLKTTELSCFGLPFAASFKGIQKADLKQLHGDEQFLAMQLIFVLTSGYPFKIQRDCKMQSESADCPGLSPVFEAFMRNRKQESKGTLHPSPSINPHKTHKLL